MVRNKTKNNEETRAILMQIATRFAFYIKHKKRKKTEGSLLHLT